MKRARAALDAWQRRHAPAAFAVAVLRKFVDDRASTLAALVAYYAFLSLFPLLLALVSLLGLVLEDNPELQEDVLDTALARIPVIGAQVQDEVHGLQGSGLGLAIGLAGALWAGLGVTIALGRAFDDIWDVPRTQQPSALRRRARGMVVLVVLALVLVAAAVGSGLAVGGGISPLGGRLGAIGAALVLNLVVFFTIYAFLPGTRQDPRTLLPGVVVAAAGSWVLQVAGGWYVDNAVVDASPTYGSFALVIGLLSWFWLGSHLLLIGAEVNVVAHRRLWPRALGGDLLPADRCALADAVSAARTDERMRVHVEFDDGEARTHA